jgi:demethoxyubiquinone hydroxylase (CLK1/Coq7/Cat5 family)
VLRDMEGSCEALIAILQLAYSGELAAAYAYRGHWRSVLSEEEKREIQTIENDEWHHRELIGKMLKDLGASPNRYREIRATVIGRSLALFCHLGGWLAPMFGAGRLESGNILEYETAARLARDSGHHELVDCLLTMAEVEWDHEQYFRSRVLSHRWADRLPIWPAPLPKETIRTRFAVPDS